jgi:hypothetical protein
VVDFGLEKFPRVIGCINPYPKNDIYESFVTEQIFLKVA